MLAAVVAAIFFDLAAPETRWAGVIELALGLTTLGVTLVIAGAGRQIGLALAGLAVVALFFAVVRGADPGAFGEAPARFVVLAVTALVLVAIGRDIVQHPRVTVRTLLGAIAFYLLLGLVFARLYAFVGAVGDGRFFVQPGNDVESSYLYFSFVTLTTVGFGDLSAVTRLGRALVVAEALLGQLYLVTIVALFVSNIERKPPPAEADGAGRPPPADV